MHSGVVLGVLYIVGTLCYGLYKVRKERQARENLGQKDSWTDQALLLLCGIVLTTILMAFVFLTETHERAWTRIVFYVVLFGAGLTLVWVGNRAVKRLQRKSQNEPEQKDNKDVFISRG